MAARAKTLQEHVVRRIKPLGLTLKQVKAAIEASAGDFDRFLNLKLKGSTVRVVIRCRHSQFTSWAMALLLNNERIDGIDWESTFVEMENGIKSGWHRHVWRSKEGSCRGNKLHLSTFNPVSAEQFIVEGLQLMRVQLSKGGINEDDQMSMD